MLLIDDPLPVKPSEKVLVLKMSILVLGMLILLSYICFDVTSTQPYKTATVDLTRVLSSVPAKDGQTQLQEVIKLTREVAQKNGFTMLINHGPRNANILLQSAPKSKDITDQVIAAFGQKNSRHS